ncbi:adenosine deaminase [Lactobacillus gasseri]|jgi:adenosine deaminase|uniref:adenosine deaminase n=1 Tax=Lactobacillus gasseri TaxID=1596 RepID=A0AB33C7Q6_LACGS|nr:MULTISPECIES: adenosine deaminase [Lactobacillus]ART98681.1 adenosine deaminase [Lactobacillus gasseri]KDA98852.1 adenosine deaminase [Lactobacillus paragasseri K7]MBO3730644.1 adenosine deaminase [Lactobacillus paragasseri]MCT7758664.1 adenosine deaminase [Lactobacillus gasseri]MCZ3494086.1 adenosine deaminase [Lactobacillus gasseri]
MKNFIDLHLHLDGSLPYTTVKKLMEVHNFSSLTDSQLKEKLSVSERCADLQEYLTKFDFPLLFLQTKKDLETATFDLLQKLRSQGLVYTEIRFAPQLHIQKDLTQEDAIKACILGLKKFYNWQNNHEDNFYPLHANLILCLMRLPDREQENYLTVKLAAKYAKEHVVGIDLAGPEGPIPNKKFKPFFDDAKEMHIPFTIHAGEAAGPESMQEALDLGTKRIGHGIRCLESEQLVQELINQHITLECCATSNLNTKVFKKIDSYPIKTLLSRKIKATLNCDNMTVSNTNLPKEFKLLETKTNLTNLDEHQLLLNSINAAFASNQEKSRLLHIFNQI